MKTCVSSYSFGKYMEPERLGLLGVIDKAAEMGFAGIEYAAGKWLTEANEATARSIGERCAERGITPVALCVGADFLSGGGKNIDNEIAQVKRHVDFAKQMGAAMLRHDISRGYTGRKYSRGYDDALPLFTRACREITEYAEQLGIATMTENHGFFSQDAARIEKLINSVAHPNFGALLDLGNFMCADEDPAVSVGLLAPYAFHVHAKDFLHKSGMEPHPGTGWFMSRAGNYLRGTVVGHGEARVAQSIGTLKRAGYDGYVTVEFEGLEDNLRGIELGLENIRKYIG